MTIYIAGPNGESLEFANEAEVEAYRRARREAEPPLLQCLRGHRATVMALQAQAERALAQRRGRSSALADIEYRLRVLRNVMSEDIQMAASEAAKEAKP